MLHFVVQGGAMIFLHRTDMTKIFNVYKFYKRLETHLSTVFFFLNFFLIYHLLMVAHLRQLFLHQTTN